MNPQAVFGWGIVSQNLFYKEIYNFQWNDIGVDDDNKKVRDA